MSNNIACMASYIIQAVRGGGCWRQESRRSGMGRSRWRRTVEGEVIVVSNPNRCGCLSASMGVHKNTTLSVSDKKDKILQIVPC